MSNRYNSSAFYSKSRWRQVDDIALFQDEVMASLCQITLVVKKSQQ